MRFHGEERTLQLRVGPGATIGRHTHAGEVHAYNVSASRQLDTGEIAGPGACVYEPAGHVDSWSCVGDERLTCPRANDDLLDYSDTPKLREFYLAWCGENGFEPITIGAAA
jgi:quercetin dioxygenase-like cupin family protein